MTMDEEARMTMSLLLNPTTKQFENNNSNRMIALLFLSL